jgi:hypothetical protein
MRNLRDQYVVVGIHPEVDAFLRVLECRVPPLAGIRPAKVVASRITAGGYPPISLATRTELRQMMVEDDRLYIHAKKVFRNSFRECFPEARVVA